MTGKRLLLIEDDQDVADMLHTYFGAYDYELMHADQGRNGIQFARERIPDMILLDVMLPDIDGFSVCSELRQTAVTRYIPVIFLTFRNDRANRMHGLGLGADDYITKPFDVDELRLRIQAALNRAQRETPQEPRTGLLTGPHIQAEIQRRNVEQQPFHAVTLALDGFRAYGDVYGFMAADSVLAYAAQTIEASIHAAGCEQDVAGFDGERFVLLTSASDPSTLLDTICGRFAEGVKAFYSFQDVERGGLLVNTDGSVGKFVPLMQLIVSL